MGEKVDFRKAMKPLYGPTIRQGLHIVDVPPMRFLMIDGKGDPNTAADYRDALETLYPVAYAIKFASKTELGRDYVVPPLEGLWWADDMKTFITREKRKWQWTMMLMVPEWVGPKVIDAAIVRVGRKKNMPKALGKLRVELLEEGRAAQVLHIGPYDDEGPVLEKMHRAFIPAQGLTMVGKHHEIYLSDPRRVVAAKLRTVLRQPVR
ncbi:GyrI-like domain-containing protein [Pelagibacterium sediminicola]|uniref:GyrI-like domain-containing protein n=1 Tax=Pelagibacterium sediminicola TaxID=2248761 RepID=UPI000E31B3AE|nr:GyrI-like domain-containing protein [Pelagibacterium sediminicola]